MVHSSVCMAHSEYLSWRLLGSGQSFIVNCASTGPGCFIGQGKIAKSYSLQMANLSVLCLLELERNREGASCDHLSETEQVRV